MIALRHQGQGCINIQLCKRLGGILDTYQFLCDGIPDSAENIILQCLKLVLRI